MGIRSGKVFPNLDVMSPNNVTWPVLGGDVVRLSGGGGKRAGVRLQFEFGAGHSLWDGLRGEGINKREGVGLRGGLKLIQNMILSGAAFSFSLANSSLTANGYRVSFWGDENSWELNTGDGCATY